MCSELTVGRGRTGSGGAHGSGELPLAPPSGTRPGRLAAPSRHPPRRESASRAPTRPSEWARRAPSRPLESPPRWVRVAPVSAQQSAHSAPNRPDSGPRALGDSPTFLAHSPTFLAHSPTFLAHSPTFLAHSATFLAHSATFLAHSATFLAHSATFLGHSARMSVLYCGLQLQCTKDGVLSPQFGTQETLLLPLSFPTQGRPAAVARPTPAAAGMRLPETVAAAGAAGGLFLLRLPVYLGCLFTTISHDAARALYLGRV